MEKLLAAEHLSVRYGGVTALDGASLTLDEGEVVALMGPNGAGKSTLLRAIFGLAPIAAGAVRWHENPIRPRAEEMVQRGIAYVPQGRRVFLSLSVRENLELGAFWVRDRAETERRLREVFELFPALAAKQSKSARTLSGGEQQMLAIGRGLMADPKVLLLDEPSLGLAPKLVKEVFSKVREINERHKTAILVVEHNIRSVLDVAHRGYVLDKGRVAAHAPAAELKESRVMEEIFLGARE